MRSLVGILVLCVSGPALARPATVRVPALPAPDADADAVGRIAGDLDLLSSMFDGSPVAEYATNKRARRLRGPAKKSRSALQRFRRTQRGRYDRRIAESSEDWGLDPFLLKGLLINESRLKPGSVGKRHYRVVNGERRLVAGGALGIAQFTGKGVSAVNEVRLRRRRQGERVYPFHRGDAMDPYLAVDAAAELLSSYIRRFGRDGGVTAYNSGPYGGRMVARYGFYRARDRLRGVGHKRIQGHQFLLNVLRHTNRLRTRSGLRPVIGPRDDRAEAVRAKKALKEKRLLSSS